MDTLRRSCPVRMGPAAALALLAVLAVQDTVVAAPAYSPNSLSYGLYWFGKNNASQKFVTGETNPYFDPGRPTLIFAHGWQPFISNSLPNFSFDGEDTAAGWIDAGWNVGIFVWNQFSDETTGISVGAWFGDGPPPQGVLDAEAKIWSANGPKGMRWRDWDNFLGGGYSSPPAGTPSAGQLFYETYVAAFPSGYDQPIRIAGHSLGNQMAVRLAYLVDQGIAAGTVPAALRPARVALLDPYWSPDPRTDIPDGMAAGQRTGDVVRQAIASLIPRGTLFEWYWSSIWTTPPQGDANDALKPMVFYAAMDPAFATEDLDKHLAAQHLYFWSHAFAGPAACAGEACLGMDRVLSRLSDAQLAAVMRSDYRWVQTEGQATATPADDAYQSVQQEGAPYSVTQLEATPPDPAVGQEATITATVAAPEGALVSFSTDLGQITPRAIASQGQATARLTSGAAGTAVVAATTRGTGGQVQATVNVTFAAPAAEEVVLTYPGGWSMVSLPVTPADGALATLFPNAISAFRFGNGYEPATALAPCEGYWLNLPAGGGTYSIAGSTVAACSRSLAAGWSMLGTPRHGTPAAAIEQNPAGSVVSIFAFVDGAYRQVNLESGTVEQGAGYWVNLSQAAQLLLSGQGD